jgi:hypothetical protein
MSGPVERPRSAGPGRRPAQRRPSSLRSALGQDSRSESMTTMTTGTCSSGNASPRQRCG